MNTNVEPVDTLVSDKLPGMAGFLQTLAGYYAQFLETDFKKVREPKRRYANQDKTGNRIGIRAEKYPSLRSILVEKLAQKTPANFLVQRAKHQADLSASMKSALAASVDTVSTAIYVSEIEKIELAILTETATKEIDSEKIVEATLSEMRRVTEEFIVSPVVNVVAPIFKRQSRDATAADQLASFSDEIVGLLLEEAESTLPTAISEITFMKDGASLRSLNERLTDSRRISNILKRYFQEFASSDAFVELREIISAQKILENTQVYLNFGEIKTPRSNFPLYYLPLTLEIEPTGIRLSFDSHIFVNKKAIDFVIGEIGKAQGSPIPNPINERIFYKDDDQTYIALANETLHLALASMQARGDIDLRAAGLTSAEGPGFKVSNDVSLSLCDKSDESIVNDYEALISGLDENGGLIEKFGDLIEGFLTENPNSIEDYVDTEWEETPTPKRLVFESPLPLAEEQRKVLSAIRHKDSRFISVEGPPGTGKSHTIAAIAFETILSGKNVLILSDKKEALDVAENKLNEVIERARGKDTDFVNPILRLGKTDSNFSNIIKAQSITKLKTSVKTFKASEESFFNSFNELKKGIRSNIKKNIKAARAIEIDDIAKFVEEEAAFYERYPRMREAGADVQSSLGHVGAMAELIGEQRSAFNKYLPEKSAQHALRKLVGLNAVLESIPANISKLAQVYPSLNLERAIEIKGLLREITDKKLPIFGYLFSRKAVAEIESELRNIVCEQDLQALSSLDDLGELSNVSLELQNLIQEHGGSPSDEAYLYRYLSSGMRLTEETLEVVAKYVEQDISPLHAFGVPETARGLLAKNHKLISMLSEHRALRAEEKRIQALFSAIPDYDYLRDKNHFESLNSLVLTNKIDERVTHFATHKKADAKTLQKLIRSKSKFPVDKFSEMKNAFPCMIAGLRDYAEFIPLEADLFDLVIIDEASQVSIAQALPAILRAKKMVVMGDRRQFGNVKTANASKALNQGYFSQVREVFDDAVAGGDISLLERCKTLNVSFSVMDFFELISNFSIQLRKHFRGYPEMISFSSKYFYDQSLQALKIRGKHITEVLEFVEVGDADRHESIRNANNGEAEAIIDRLEAMCEFDSPPSVAVITPFRQQQQFVQNLVATHPRAEEFEKKLKIAVFTFDSCQGEERDVILYSMVATRDLDGLNYIFPPDLRSVSEDDLDGKLKFQRMNVGFSRGKEKLVFLLSKPLEEYKGAVGQALRHYALILDSASAMPTVADVDSNSPMEAKLLDWIKSTAFFASNAGNIELIPQFPLGEYLKALDPTYTHPDYKVDFLVRLRSGESIQQIVIEYDGFEYHFIDRQNVNAMNWQAYLTDGDVERERVLESYGYKMLRVNRFNVGKDPISALDRRLTLVFGELANKHKGHKVLEGVQAEVETNVRGLENGTHKNCTSCEEIRPKTSFFDPKLASNYGRYCMDCKS